MTISRRMANADSDPPSAQYTRPRPRSATCRLGEGSIRCGGDFRNQGNSVSASPASHWALWSAGVCLFAPRSFAPRRSASVEGRDMLCQRRHVLHNDCIATDRWFCLNASREIQTTLARPPSKNSDLYGRVLQLSTSGGANAGSATRASKSARS